MRTDIEGKDFQSMLAGEGGVFHLDLARDFKEILEDNSRLRSDIDKWQKEAGDRGDKIAMLINEKSVIEEQHKSLKLLLSELSK